MKFAASLAFADTEDYVELAQVAEDHGWDTLVLSDHVVHPEQIAAKYPYREDGQRPWEAPDHWPDNWVADHLAFGILGKKAKLPHVSDFYLGLLERPSGSVTLVEAPWFPPIFADALPHYQRIHRQRVRIGFTSARDSRPGRGELPYPAPGFELDNFVFVEDLLGPGPAPADYLVLHRDLRREYDLSNVPILLELAGEQHKVIGPLVERCRSRFGAPDYEDEWLVVFKLR